MPLIIDSENPLVLVSVIGGKRTRAGDDKFSLKIKQEYCMNNNNKNKTQIY